MSSLEILIVRFRYLIGLVLWQLKARVRLFRISYDSASPCACWRCIGSYLDMIWYGVNVNHVTDIALDMIKKIDVVVDNIKLPETTEDIEKAAKAWSDI